MVLGGSFSFFSIEIVPLPLSLSSKGGGTDFLPIQSNKSFNFYVPNLNFCGTVS